MRPPTGAAARFTRFATRAAAVLADYELEANILIQLGPLFLYSAKAIYIYSAAAIYIYSSPLNRETGAGLQYI